MAIDTPHHYIPDITPTARITANVTQQYRVEVNTTTQNITSIVTIRQSTGAPIDFELIIAILVLTILVLLLLSLGLQRVEEYRRIEAKIKGEPYRPKPMYRYEGLRLQLRRIYEDLLARASSAGVVVPPGYTVSEASAKLRYLIGEWASWFARVYNRYMYGVEEPPPSVVEEAKRRVSGEGD